MESMASGSLPAAYTPFKKEGRQTNDKSARAVDTTWPSSHTLSTSSWRGSWKRGKKECAGRGCLVLWVMTLGCAIKYITCGFASVSFLLLFFIHFRARLFSSRRDWKTSLGGHTAAAAAATSSKPQRTSITSTQHNTHPSILSLFSLVKMKDDQRVCRALCFWTAHFIVINHVTDDERAIFLYSVYLFSCILVFCNSQFVLFLFEQDPNEEINHVRRNTHIRVDHTKQSLVLHNGTPFGDGCNWRYQRTCRAVNTCFQTL